MPGFLNGRPSFNNMPVPTLTLENYTRQLNAERLKALCAQRDKAVAAIQAELDRQSSKTRSAKPYRYGKISPSAPKKEPNGFQGQNRNRNDGCAVILLHGHVQPSGPSSQKGRAGRKGCGVKKDQGKIRARATTDCPHGKDDVSMERPRGYPRGLGSWIDLADP
jgi:hypothetical protein